MEQIAAPVTKRKINKLAIVGLFLLAISRLWPEGEYYNLAGNLLALIVSVIALIQIKRRNEKGKLLALAGIVIPVLTFGYILLIVFAYRAWVHG